MKCPQYIKELLRKRAACAENFTNYDCQIADWLEKHGIEVETYDIGGGCESISNPWRSSNRILEAIEEG